MIKPIIRTPKRKDGLYRIHYDISHRGGRLFIDSGILTSDKLTKHGRVKDLVNADLKNSKIIRDMSDIERVLLKHQYTALADLRSAIEAVVKGEKTGSLIDYVEKHIEKCERGQIKVSPLVIKQYRSFVNKLKLYRADVMFDQVNKDFYQKFVQHLSEGRSINTVDNAIKHIKMFMRLSYDEGLHQNTEFQKRYFKRIKVQTDHIALTAEELAAIATVSLPSHLKEERDRFIVSTYLLLRFTDSQKISKAKFEQKMFDGKPKVFFKAIHSKTKTGVVVPVKAEVVKILEARSYKFTSDANQEANWKIKEICRLAGIDEEIEINGKTAPKYEFVSTHTARRTGATLLYLATKDLNLVKMIGGWKTLSSLQLYLRVDRLAATEEAMKSEFFK